MATPFAAAAKDLIEMAPADWLAFLGQPRPPGLVRVIDADLSATVSTSTDKVIRVDDPEPWLLLVELQAAWDGDLPFDLLRRYALLRHRHRLPVSCAIVLLRPEANTSAMTGTFSQPHPLGRAWDFPFHVVRVWETPAEVFVRGPLGMPPLAPIAAVDRPGVLRVLSEVEDRFKRAGTRALRERLEAVTIQPLALRFDDAFIAKLVEQMTTVDLDKSPLFQAIGNRAVLAHARETILRLGTQRFGPPTAEVEARIRAFQEVAQLDAIWDRLFAATGWDDLLAGAPTP